MEFKDWIFEVASKEWNIYIKRLSANDTGATKSHQVGVYFPKPVLGSIFPSLNGEKGQKNSDVTFKAVIESHGVPEQELRAVYYSQKTRNEKRITRWKQGIKYTPIQDKEQTGSIAIFAFNANNGDSDFMRAWVCRNVEEEEFLEEKIGEIDPQKNYFERGDVIFEGVLPSGHINEEKYPEEWEEEFPSGTTIIDYLFKCGFHADATVDQRILKRRDHEFNLFKLVEEHHTLPLIEKGFKNVEEFIKLANSISNRRKSRSGKSLELHLEKIFIEEGLSGKFESQCTTEGKKKPDFLFPDCNSYQNNSFPDDLLRMLAVKTTVKDRWRQILNEAKRIQTPFLFTLQNGVSINQFEEMKEENVKLVVPQKIHKSYPESIRSELYTLNGFIEEIKNLY